MNARFRLPIVALCFAGMLAGCGSVTQGTQFQPPNGWGASPSIMGRAQVWFKSGKNKGDVQLLMLMKTDPNKTDFNTIASSSQTKDLHQVSKKSVKFCGTQEGLEYAAVGSGSNGEKTSVEVTTTRIGNDRYSAIYVRPASMVADRQAEAAIHSLCPVTTK